MSVYTRQPPPAAHDFAHSDGSHEYATRQQSSYVLYGAYSVGSVYAREKQKSGQTGLVPILNIRVTIVGG
jgi:hypothetical protein